MSYPCVPATARSRGDIGRSFGEGQRPHDISTQALSTYLKTSATVWGRENGLSARGRGHGSFGLKPTRVQPSDVVPVQLKRLASEG